MKPIILVCMFLVVIQIADAVWVRPVSSATGVADGNNYLTNVIASNNSPHNFTFYLSGLSPISVFVDDISAAGGGNSSEEMIFAVNNTYLNGTKFKSLNCSEIIFTGGVQGASGICDGVDSVGYNSLSDLQITVSNDFHNLGGVDADTWFNVTSIQVTGTTTKTLNLEQLNGIPNRTTSWTDIDTDTNNYTSAFSTNSTGNLNTFIIRRNDSTNLSVTVTDKGNSSAEIQAAELDSAHDTCSEIANSVCVASSNQITLAHSNITNVPTYADNFTNTFTFNISTNLITLKIMNFLGINKSLTFTDKGNSSAEMVEAVNKTLGIYTGVTVPIVNVNGTSSATDCSGTNKVTDVTLTNGVISTVCAADQTGTSEYMFDQGLNTTNATRFANLTVTDHITIGNYIYHDEPDYPQPLFSDMLVTGSHMFFSATAISAGTLTSGEPSRDNIGVVCLQDSTTANGGYLFQTGTSTFLLSGNETARIYFMDNSSRATTISWFGFQDSATATLPTDGCYFYIANNNLTTACRSNNVQTNGTGSYQITDGQWNDGWIRVNSSATYVNFTLYSQTGAPVFSNNVSTNIPNATGRQAGFMMKSIETTTDAAANIACIDFVSIAINRRTTRGYSP